MPRVLKVISELDADIVAVQEIFDGQAAIVAREMGIQYVFGEVRTLQDQGYGNAVFTRLPIVDSEQFDLTVKRREPRSCLRVALEPGPIQFFGVHLGTSFPERRQQARRLLSKDVLERPDFKGVRIVAGDFNEWTRGLATKLLSQHLESADVAVHLKRRRTYPGFLPLLHLDHIYYDRAFRLTEMHWHRTAAAMVVSDHLPLVAAFTMNRDCQS